MQDENSRVILSLPLSDWVSYLFIGGVAASLLSIFLSGLIFGVGLVFWCLDCIERGRVHLEAPPFKILIYLFFLLTCVAILFSPDFWASIWYLKKFVKFLSLFFIYTYVKRHHIERALPIILSIIGASAIWSVLEYLWIKDVSLLNRIDGFMSHWMTFSGQVMIGSVALAGYLIFNWRYPSLRTKGHILLAPLLPVLIGVTLLTMTRSAWIGMAGGLLLLLVSFKLRWAAVGLACLMLVFLLLPGSFKERLYSSFDLTDMTTRGRLELIYTGSRMIEDHPWTGVGPRLVYQKALEYRGEDEFLPYLYQHLHNNLLQVAAELGIPAAVVWLAIWIWMITDFLRFRYSKAGDPFLGMLATVAFSVLASFHLMGLFEYNFGDSEIAVLMLFFVTIPYAYRKELAKRG